MVLLPKSAQLNLVGSVCPVRVNYPDLRTGFWVRNKENLVVSSSGKLQGSWSNAYSGFHGVVHEKKYSVASVMLLTSVRSCLPEWVVI